MVETRSDGSLLKKPNVVIVSILNHAENVCMINSSNLHCHRSEVL
jgi:hypothetical protein